MSRLFPAYRDWFRLIPPLSWRSFRDCGYAFFRNRTRVFWLVLLLFFWARLMGISDSNGNHIPEAGFKTEAGELFESLLREDGLIEISSDNRIGLPQQDYVLDQYWNKHVTVSDRKRYLLERLIYSQAGRTVQQEVNYWNRSRRFVAVRDNDATPSAQSGKWRIGNEWGESLSGGGVVPLNYGFVSGGRFWPGINDWVMASDDQPMVARKSWSGLAKPLTVRIQLIGRPNLSKLTYPHKLLACISAKTGCKESAPVAEAEAYQLTVTLPAGDSELILPLQPVLSLEKQVDGVMIHQANKAGVGSAAFAWRQLGHGSAVNKGEKTFDFTILTRDGEVLSLPGGGEPSAYTQANGLLGLVGYDRNDRYALSGLMARSALPHDQTEMRLTLDSKLQQLAQKQLLAGLKKIDPTGLYDERRRAALVVIEPETGAIRAVANYPEPPAGISRWDRLAFSKLYANRDPFRLSAWQVINSHYAPGSTFKPVTALAAIRAAYDGRDDLMLMLRGLDFDSHMFGTNLTELAGLNKGSNAYSTEGISPVSNFAGEALGNSIGRALRADGCGVAVEESGTVGLREAIRDSSNVWFVRLGLMTDELNLNNGGRDTYLNKVAEYLGFGESFSLLGDTEVPLRRVSKRQGEDVLTALSGKLTLQSESNNPEAELTAKQRLAQNSFGQGMAATPLQMARVAAAIATGHLSTPYLIESWDGETIAPVKGADLSRWQGHWWDGDLYDYLRQGLKAVPETGSAKTAFGQYAERCRVFGKTGTAETGKQAVNTAFNTAWFIGWREDKDQRPDYAFACMVTHAYKPYRTGGSVCAPIVANFLKEMDKLSANQPVQE